MNVVREDGFCWGGRGEVIVRVYGDLMEVKAGVEGGDKVTHLVSNCGGRENSVNNGKWVAVVAH